MHIFHIAEPIPMEYNPFTAAIHGMNVFLSPGLCIQSMAGYDL